MLIVVSADVEVCRAVPGAEALPRTTSRAAGSLQDRASGGMAGHRSLPASEQRGLLGLRRELCDPAGVRFWLVSKAHTGGGLRIYRPAHPHSIPGTRGVGDDLEISTWLTEIRNASVGRHYDLIRVSDGELLAQVRIQYLAVDPASGRPRRFPPGMLEDYADNIAEGAR